ncbi:hypothetical protein CLV24_101283 [Pontibacter ummariensis]|uniref:Uncharacterized protein n=1 Tax=Pontibacter ummariensis TaxID=1610492 RepID=A0A239BAS8_9BACT|nr:hypothetical protein [Pontibacter ummariensis]PRY16437.1 hypothetical protein CLV24_101283 [Pontibacter ummariensis]SNS05125.1 hypothetical protein SAMN06296052_101283 [Pontibacter ummariensis]
MPKYNLTWEPSDAALLEALVLATGGEGGAPLLEVLLMADALDGNVLTQKEVEQGLEKLMAIQYVQITKNKLLLSPQFMQDYTAIEGAENEQEALFKLLKTKPLAPESLDEPKILLKKYKLKNYYQQYLEQFGGNN